MRNVRLLFVVLLIVFLLLMVGIPSALAQDATETPVQDVPVVVGENGTAAINLITLIAGIGVGLIAGGGSVLFVVDRLRNDKVTIAAVEALAKSFPPEIREMLNHLAEFTYEVTDDIPFEDKPRSATDRPSNLN